MSKLILLFACFFTLSFYIEPIKCLGEDEILGFLEELRARMCHPIEKFGLPALDPLEIKHAEIAKDNQYLIDFSGSVTDFKLTGLSDFDVTDIRISTIRSSYFDIIFPLTGFTSLYTAKGSLAYILNLAGDGHAAAHIDKFRIRLQWTLRAVPKISITNFKLNFYINEIFVDFENLLEEERINDFFHALINELGLELLGDLWEEKQQGVEKTIEKKLNNILGQYTLSEIIKIITGGGDEPIFGPNDPPPDCKDNTHLSAETKKAATLQ